MSMESFENNEVSRESVVETLRTKGFEDPGAKELLMKFRMGQEAIAQRTNTNRANMECELVMARVYFDAGLPKELVHESFEDVRMTIENDYRTDHSDLLAEVNSYLDKLET